MLLEHRIQYGTKKYSLDATEIGKAECLTRRYAITRLTAKKYRAYMLDAEKYAVGSLKKVYKEFPHLKKILPAMGYGKKQMKELENTINKSGCDIVVSGTPIDLVRLLKINKPILNVNHELEVTGTLK